MSLEHSAFEGLGNSMATLALSHLDTRVRKRLLGTQGTQALVHLMHLFSRHAKYGLGVMLYNTRTWSSEVQIFLGRYIFFVVARTIYQAFNLTGNDIFKIAHNM